MRKPRALDTVAPLGVTVTETVPLLQTESSLFDTIDTEFVAGTVTVIEVLVQEETLAVTVPNFTTPGAPKPAPRIVTLVPTAPWVGDNERMLAVDTGGIVVVVTGGAVVVVTGGAVVVVVGGLVVVVVVGGLVVVVVVGGLVVVVVVGGAVVVVVVGGLVVVVVVGAAATVIEKVVEATTPARTHTV
jgi:hypothetical protein